MNNSKGDFEVGYGRPPAATRFKKGQSGNPKGRPKGALNLATVLGRTLQERVVINEGGQRKTVTKLEAAVKQLVNKAAGGDLGAFRQLKELVRSAEERSTENPNSGSEMTITDQKVMDSVLKRFESTLKTGDDK